MFKTISIADLINQSHKQIDFLVDKFEDMVEPENIEFPHTHNFYEILWITNGTSGQNIDYKNYTISEDTLFFISPGQLHLFEEWENIQGYAILFTEQFFLQIFQNKNILFELSYLDNFHENPFLKLKNEDKKAIEPIVDLLYQESKSSEKSTETIQALLLVLLRRIQKIFSAKNNQNSSKHQMVIFKQFKNLIELNFAKNLSVSDYASQLHISTHHLNTSIKTISGKTPTEIIKKRIILEAQQLLHFSELTVSQITDQLGFEDSSYFARYFKKQVGVSPLEFRKSIS
ncbi:AraC family transcriptional regulator [Chryseobacterium sp. G0201]|uniref:AraC family transcriptional regulator n=1 Tax=Chryseobacterium sp. G0201 TaxID=2487065 RepID=UPI000F50EBF5|nr:AraC family transcriptional regulator [Chryseobacterium sp. G0201]AZA54584.1 helix-turn-helix domain-containing protein [Chryseobacterium sp. G0201]